MRGVVLVTRGLSWVLMALGGAIVLVQSFWITYGVFVRYVLRDPDRYVTEATALLMVPLAFLGLPYALRSDGLPRVTFLLDRLSGRARLFLDRANLALMTAIGVFLAAVGINATANAFDTGSTSAVLGWSVFPFWAPVAASAVMFTIAGLLRLVALDTEGSGVGGRPDEPTSPPPR